LYESFGATVKNSSVQFRLFIPDNTVDAKQYTRGGPCRLRTVRVVGSFQINLRQKPWDLASAPLMKRTEHPNGWLYTFEIAQLPDGFYEYKYFVEFENGTTRWCSDPCSKYDGSNAQNSPFVIGGNDMTPQPIGKRLALADLVIYELMLDDFTREYREARAPLDAVEDKLEDLRELGINAIEFMPWTAWNSDEFSWGYNPYAFFTVEHAYYNDPTSPLDKLFRLKRLIDKIHRMDMHVIMDGVFNHVDAGQDPNKGFGYFWLWEVPADSPYIGPFAASAYFNDFDFGNECTNEFITDVAKYWMNDYKIDGIRFDYVLGFYKKSEQPVGISRVIENLNQYAATTNSRNMSFTLEMLPDNRYDAVGKTNEIQASGCWYDQFMWDSFEVGPVRGSIGWLALGCPRQHFGLNPIRHFVAHAPRVPGEQPRQPIRGKACAPASNIAVAAIELGANLRPGQSLGPQQNQAGLSSLIGTSVPCTCLPLQCSAFACGQCHLALHRRDDTPI
jgi:pullulanase